MFVRAIVAFAILLFLQGCVTSKVPLLPEQSKFYGPDALEFFRSDSDGKLILNDEGKVDVVVMHKREDRYITDDNMLSYVLGDLGTKDYYLAQIAMGAPSKQFTYAIVHKTERVVELYFSNPGHELTTPVENNHQLNDVIKGWLGQLGRADLFYRVVSTDADISALSKEAQSAEIENKPGRSITQQPEAEIHKNEFVSVVLPCDELAAHPYDPNRMATGVTLSAMVPLRALAACQDAAGNHPNSPRMIYQLGRALHASNKLKEAGLEILKASEMGYAIADYEIGVDILENAGAGYQEKAKTYLQRALAGGVQQAQEQLDKITFTISGYQEASILREMYESGSPSLPRGTLMIYFEAFDGMFYHSDNSICSNLVSSSTSVKTGLAVGIGGIGVVLQNPIGFAELMNEARSDAQKFYDKYGCDTPVAVRMFANVNRWVASH